MRKKQILFVIDSLGCGGAERSLISLLPKLDNNRAQIHLMTMSRGGVFEQFLSDGITIMSFPEHTGVSKALFKASQGTFSIKTRLFSLLSIRRHRAEMYWSVMSASYPTLNTYYDVAVAYHQGFPTYYVAEKVKAAKKIAWINTDMSKAGYRQNYNRSYYDRYDNVVAVSDILRERLCSQGYVVADKISTIYDINDAYLIRKMAKEDVFITPSDSSLLRLATVGRMVPIKNYSLAVETAKSLKQRGIRFLWTMVGDGADRSKIEKLIRQYDLEPEISLVGLRPNPYPYIAQCDIYVNTSLFEGFGLTLTEARILNKPIVTTNFSVVNDQISDGVNGLVVEPEAEALAEAIIRLFNDRQLYTDIVSNIQKEAYDTSAASIAMVESLLCN